MALLSNCQGYLKMMTPLSSALSLHPILRTRDPIDPTQKHVETTHFYLSYPISCPHSSISLPLPNNILILTLRASSHYSLAEDQLMIISVVFLSIAAQYLDSYERN